MIKTLLLIFFTMTGTAGALDLSVQEAISIALENNRDIQIEKENVVVSEGEITTQKGFFDPILNISSFYNDGETPTVSTFIPRGTVNQQDFNVTGNLEGKFSTGTFYDVLNFSSTRTETDSPLDDLSPNWFNNLSFSIGQELLRNFGVNVNNTFVITARRSNQISEKEFENVITNVILDVESRYWLLVASKQNLELERTALELAQDLQRRNEIQVEVGVLPRVSVTQAKSEVAAREVDVIRAENTLQAAEDNLKNVLAMDLAEEINTTDEPTTEVFQFDEQESLDEAYRERPEIKQAKLNIENRETLKGYYSNQRLPRLAIEGGIQLQGLGGDENPDRLSFGGEPEPIPSQFLGSSEAFSQIFGADFTTWQILGVFSFPIFNRTAKGEYVKARAEFDRSVITLKKTQDDVALDVRSAIREIKNSLRAIDAAHVSVELAKEVVINEQERLNVGIGTTREVLEAQRDLIDAGVREITAIANYNIALAELERAKGTLLENKGVVIKE
ncbi:MAG: TolC family protein [Candidatus Dadabacteria bacterium]|nr:TolC family protein [Candidatus Dadabacteria bacterium]